MRSDPYSVHIPALSLPEAAMLPAKEHVDDGGWPVDNLSEHLWIRYLQARRPTLSRERTPKGEALPHRAKGFSGV